MAHPDAIKVRTIYYALTLLTTLSASFIWGINTLFLLDAGLTNTEAFAANAFFTAGMMLFEVPTGVVADTWGRRASFLLGALTLLISTLFYLYLWHIKAGFLLWALSSLLIGLGFTFFSGAVEAWIVDAMIFCEYEGSIDSVFARGQVFGGAAMLFGSVTGGIVAQSFNLGVPYLLRAIMLGLNILVAFLFMRDLGFTPKKPTHPIAEMNKILKASIDHGWRKPSVRWVMCAAPFTTGAGFFAFYAMQPYLLELYGKPDAYSIAGLAAAIIATAQILGGLLVSKVMHLFKSRTSMISLGVVVSCAAMVAIGLTSNFIIAIVFIAVWAMVMASTGPVRQSYLNGQISSEQRATVLSFDSLIGSSGGVVFQPGLGKAADIYSYSFAYIAGSVIQLLALPCYLKAKLQKASSDTILPD